MGLCKCPKKKVTNLFCFEHRVNVCEHCLVESHPSCVVQSYLAWLQDSDYDANCSLCATGLHERETVRLQCLHLFHWDCVDAWARRFPPTTAPAGYRCPQCREALFPTDQQKSPTIDRLRQMLQRANWARAALGLSLLPDSADSASPPSVHAKDNSDYGLPHNIGNRPGPGGGGPPPIRSATPTTVVQFENDAYSQNQGQFTSRKPNFDGDYGGSTTALLNGKVRDEDLPENKYKRRSATEWFQRWMRSRYPRRSTTTMSDCKRFCFFSVIFLLAAATLITVLLRVMSGPSPDDPLLDPMANPNIRVAEMEHINGHGIGLDDGHHGPGMAIGEELKDKWGN